MSLLNFYANVRGIFIPNSTEVETAQMSTNRGMDTQILEMFLLKNHSAWHIWYLPTSLCFHCFLCEVKSAWHKRLYAEGYILEKAKLLWQTADRYPAIGRMGRRDILGMMEMLHVMIMLEVSYMNAYTCQSS